MEISSSDVTSNEVGESQLTVAVEDLMKWWMTPGDLTKLEPVVDALMKIMEWNGGIVRPTSTEEIP